jgi:hypothetical protein
MPSEKQQDLLLQAPAQGSLEKKDGFTYISHQAIRVNLIRIFGWGRWSFELIDQECLHEGKRPNRKGGDNWIITYRVMGRLSVEFDDGRTATFTEAAVDSAINPMYEQAHDNAVKSASSMAIRRCAMNLGSVFGLGLYFDGYTGEAIKHTIDSSEEPTNGQA